MNGQWTNKVNAILASAAFFGAVAASGVIALAQPNAEKAPEKGGAPIAPPGAAAPAVAVEPVKVPVNLTLAPATTYAANCVRCHGVDGVKRVSGGWNLATNKRIATVTGMMKNQNRAKLTTATAADIEAMAAHVQSLKGGAFAAIVNGADFAEGKSEKLMGDATPGAKVTLVKDGKETPITLTKSAWTVDAAPKAPFTIKAVNGDFTAEFNFPEKQWAFTANPANKVAAPAKGADKAMDKGAADKAAEPAKAN